MFDGIFCTTLIIQSNAQVVVCDVVVGGKSEIMLKEGDTVFPVLDLFPCHCCQNEQQENC